MLLLNDWCSVEYHPLFDGHCKPYADGGDIRSSTSLLHPIMTRILLCVFTLASNRSKSSFGRQISGQLSSDHRSYCHDFILSLLLGPRAPSYVFGAASFYSGREAPS